mmetsp:Transcript_4933/g.7304  ORF Transcript_4933/g.7304 Transcript_4933/m.7304 type:complete len:227 (-) Transcript_4933:122-802(-)|eukprot:CAMPEP_0167763006 /NCGR_PEP_ID=MMETSP0110_2-20121227/13102_1 /TAXON_ID=629695 /ORGANISM="Gymnochlora sp., Strain CCMP2014" /LENGTH=226 /DNA_ID=CAMNT_0007649981 /DNA_START=86 /DNA_END=766 /DNA_ORIENTATION=-
MPILYTLIAHKAKPLAEHVNGNIEGTYGDWAKKILAKLQDGNSQQSFRVQDYIFNCTKMDDITYLSMTDAKFDRAACFSFLNTLRRRFASTYGSSAKSAVSYAYNSEFSPVIEALLENNGEEDDNEENGETDRLLRINSKVKELKGVMAENIGMVLQRGEKVDLLVEKSEVLDINAGAFRRNATSLQRAMYWKNVKTYLAMGGLGSGFLYIVLSSVCGGMSLPYCV